MQHLAHPASVDAYIRHGWSLVPIPSGTKGPATKGWNRKENVLPGGWALPHGYGIGLAHAYSGTMALDIDDWDRAAFELMMKGINLQALYDASDAVIVDSGRKGHGKLLYAMPFGLALPSKKLMDKLPDGSDYNYLDFRCGTSNDLTVQDVMPPSIHPDTGQPYRWAGKGHWTRLPVIPQSLLDLWMSLIGDTESTEQLPAFLSPPPSESWDEIRTMLGHVNPDVSRKDWIDCGMAVHLRATQTDEKDQGFQVWHEWSAKGYKYPGEHAVRGQWNSFSSDKGNLVTIGTLKHLAREHGWKPPLPDLTDLFSSVPPPSTPESVLHSFAVPPPECDASLFPTVLHRRAAEVAEGVGCDPIVPLFAGLAAVSAVIDARSRLKLADGWKVPPVLWLMTIGEPADKKTPGSKPMLTLLEDLQRENIPDHNKALLAWEGHEAAYAASKKAFLEFCASPEALMGHDNAPKVQESVPRPVPLRLVISDITSQDLIRKAAERPAGLLCYLDEMNSWINKINDKRSGENRSSWVMAYEASSYYMDRVGAGSIHAENLAISMYGNVQPQVFRENVKALSSDGLLQRFVLGVIPARKWRRGNPLPDYLSTRNQWENALRTVHALPEMEYSLSPEAADLFHQFQTWYGQRLNDERFLQATSTYMTALGKLEGTLGRLALIMHVLDAPFSQQVGADTMRNAIKFVCSYIVPSLKHVYSEMVEEDMFEKWMAEHILQHSDQPMMSMTQLTHGSRHQLGGLPKWQAEQKITIAMITMEQVGWVIKLDTGSRSDEAVWAVSPALADQFNNHRRNVIDAKQRLQNKIWSESGRMAPRVYGA